MTILQITFEGLEFCINDLDADGQFDVVTHNEGQSDIVTVVSVKPGENQTEIERNHPFYGVFHLYQEKKEKLNGLMIDDLLSYTNSLKDARIQIDQSRFGETVNTSFVNNAYQNLREAADKAKDMGLYDLLEPNMLGVQEYIQCVVEGCHNPPKAEEKKQGPAVTKPPEDTPPDPEMVSEALVDQPRPTQTDSESGKKNKSKTGNSLVIFLADNLDRSAVPKTQDELDKLEKEIDEMRRQVRQLRRMEIGEAMDYRVPAAAFRENHNTKEIYDIHLETYRKQDWSPELYYGTAKDAYDVMDIITLYSVLLYTTALYNEGEKAMGGHHWLTFSHREAARTIKSCIQMGIAASWDQASRWARKKRTDLVMAHLGNVEILSLKLRKHELMEEWARMIPGERVTKPLDDWVNENMDRDGEWLDRGRAYQILKRAGAFDRHGYTDPAIQKLLDQFSAQPATFAPTRHADLPSSLSLPAPGETEKLNFDFSDDE